jgi:hypothetical protein
MKSNKSIINTITVELNFLLGYLYLLAKIIYLSIDFQYLA